MITVIIPTSPSVTNPDTTIIDTCISSIRRYLPDSKIIITYDGVRKELRHHEENYSEFKQVMRSKYTMDNNIQNIEFSSHKHQSGMIIEALTCVSTDLIFYVEHDWELVGEIPFKQMSEIINEGTADLIRILWPPEISPYHQHMMYDKEPQLVNGLPLVRTWQWSQNPHLASVEFYKELLTRYFTPDPCNFIEEVLAGKIVAAHQRKEFDEFKTFIYAPKPDAQRCIHLDGRKGEQHHF